MPSLADYYFIKCLGQGGSATVNLVRHKKSGKIYALKQVDK
jgi:serine/threonine protein kinase